MVRRRLSVCTDLVADEAVYHTDCHAKFFSSDWALVSKENRGRKESTAKLSAFGKMCDWLDQQNELYTLQDLHNKMIEHSGGTDVYGTKRIKQKLQEKYGDYIFFAEISGQKNVVCFRNTASLIISDKWYEERNSNVDEEGTRILDMAAKLIKNSLRIAVREKYTIDTFPSAEDATKLGWIPEELRRFLANIIKSEPKVESIGQCIVKAAMPRSVLPPILFALSVQLDHVFGSKWQLSLLEKLGFSLSYCEVNRFKQTVVMSDNIEDIIQSIACEGCYITFVADNVDHNTATLDGLRTFHGMGVMAVITNSGKSL